MRWLAGVIRCRFDFDKQVPLVSGSTVALIMAMAGRAAYCDELNGDGVATLRARCPTP